MSLTSSMWTSVSGLLAHGEKMNVVGNNISNVNTVAYKSQRMDFQDFVYQHMGTAGGFGQVGKGTAIGAIMNDFSQGSMESTTSSTDIAIEGNGFFCVRPASNNTSYYTRAGNFAFNSKGELVDPNGYVLQAWKINQNASGNVSRSDSGIVGTGSPVDVRLETFTCPPKHTTSVSLPLNLRNSSVASTDDKSTDATDPFFALLKTWDASQTNPLGSSQYAYQSTLNVYDEAGKLHKLTIYFDRVAHGNGGQNLAGSTDGESYWEYLITMDPGEDLRDFNSSYSSGSASATSPNVPDSLKGLLGAGTITFNSSGQMKDMSAFVPHSDPEDPNDQWWTGEAGSERVDLGKWVAAPIDDNGFPVVAPNFSGTGGQQLAYKDGKWVGANPEADGRLVSIDLGLKINSSEWAFATGPSIPATAIMALTEGPLTADGLPVGEDGVTALDLGGPIYDAAQLPATPYPPVRRTDASGNEMTLYLVENTTDASLPPYYYSLTPPTDAAAIKSETPLWDPDPRAIYNGQPDRPVNAAEIGSSKYHINGMDGLAEAMTYATTCYGDSFYEQNGARQDGYGHGSLRDVNVGSTGVISATYSNGVTLELYQIVLYDFPSTQNLRREGGNLYTETRDSGSPGSGAAGTGSFGATQGYYLEQSNADISREFVNMITTQRGFQANSKTITTVDTMLETVISMKR